MSFTSVVKNEVSKIEAIKTENIAELSAVVHNSETSDKQIWIPCSLIVSCWQTCDDASSSSSGHGIYS